MYMSVIMGLAGCLAGNAPEEGWLETPDGVRLYYRVRGEGPRTVIVPFAAWLADDFEPLAAGRRLIFYDMRGRGRSDAVEDPGRLGIDFDVEDLETVRRHFGVERPALIGFSYLGAVVALYAAEHPGTAARIVQAAPIPPWAGADYVQQQEPATAFVDAGKLGALQERMQKQDPAPDPRGVCESFWDVFLPAYLSDGQEAGRLLPGLVDRTCDLPNETPAAFLKTLGHVFEGLEQRDWRPLAGAVDAPTLVIHGRQDHVAPPAGAQEWASRIPEARLLTVADSGHMIWLEQPEIFFEAIETFLEGEWPGQP